MVNAVRGNGFEFKLVGKALVVGVLLGLAAELLGRVSDFFRDRKRLGTEPQSEEEALAAKFDLESSFPLWWSEQPEMDGGLDEALNVFIERHNLMLNGKNERIEDAKLRIIEQSDLSFDNPEDEARLNSYQMGLRLAGFRDRMSSSRTDKTKEA